MSKARKVLTVTIRVVFISVVLLSLIFGGMLIKSCIHGNRGNGVNLLNVKTSGVQILKPAKMDSIPSTTKKQPHLALKRSKKASERSKEEMPQTKFSIPFLREALAIIATLAIVAIMIFIFKWYKKKGLGRQINLPSGDKKIPEVKKARPWKSKLLYRASVFGALGVTAYIFFDFGILTKLFNALSSTMFGVYVPFMREIQIVMIVIFVIGFVIKTNSTIRDLALGRHRIWFPFVGQIPFALLCLINNLCFVLILVSFGYHYLVLALIKIGCNYLCLEVGEGHGTLAITLVSLPIFANLMSYTYKPFFVSVPAFVGLVTESVFGGEYYIHRTGLRFKYIWEVAKIEEGYFSTKTITVPFAEDFVSLDGGVVHIEGSFNYRPNIDRLDNYARTSESTIVLGFTNRAKELLTREIVKRTADQARTQTKEIKVMIEALYKEEKGQPKLTEHDEEEYGVDFLDFTIADVGYDKTTQNVLSTAFNVSKLKEMSDEMGGDNSDDNISKNIDRILTFEGKMEKKETVHRFILETEGLKDIHPDVMKAVATVGPIIADRYIN
ncbi:MAG: SPFH domain-containing protein, partial [Patescibacteria group bacterium]